MSRMFYTHGRLYCYLYIYKAYQNDLIWTRMVWFLGFNDEIQMRYLLNHGKQKNTAETWWSFANPKHCSYIQRRGFTASGWELDLSSYKSQLRAFPPGPIMKLPEWHSNFHSLQSHEATVSEGMCYCFLCFSFSSTHRYRTQPRLYVSGRCCRAYHISKWILFPENIFLSSLLSANCIYSFRSFPTVSLKSVRSDTGQKNNPVVTVNIYTRL